MHRFLILFICAILPLLAEERCKPKILVLSCQGGYAHTAAAKTMQTLLENDYTLKIIHPINEIRFFGLMAVENMYNSVLGNGWIRSMNFAVHYLAPTIVRTKFGRAERVIQRYINEEKPDLILSLIPYINLPASNVAKNNNIPYLLVPVDFDLKNYVLGMEKMSHPNFRVTVGTEEFYGKGRLLLKGIPEETIENIGLPIRLDFFEAKNIEELKKSYHIPLDRYVVLLMMGGAGGKNALEYAKKISTIKDLPIHLIVCCGRNEALRKEIQKVPLDSVTIIGFTDKIADLMSLSDLLISKPGPGTINEAISMHLPILADATSSILYWEKANIEMLQSLQIGDCIKSLHVLPRLLRTYLTDAETRKRIEEAYEHIPPNQFHEKIIAIIDEMAK